MIYRIEQKSFKFLFEKLGVRDQSNVNGQPRAFHFHALDAATENASSDETSFECGTTRSCLPAEQSHDWSTVVGRDKHVTVPKEFFF